MSKKEITLPMPLEEINEHLTVHIWNLRASRKMFKNFCADWDRFSTQINKLENTVQQIRMVKQLDTD